jgi:molybdenum storage protein
VSDQILTQLGAALVDGSLTDEALLAETAVPPVFPILAEANVIKIGGQGVIDRGRAAVFPLLDELVANLAQHKMIIGTGAVTAGPATPPPTSEPRG